MFIKRFIDIVISLIGIIILLPILILISIAIKLDSKGPVLFIQERVGKDEELFNVYKFRTMYVNADELKEEVKASEKDPRITRVGSFLRKWSLDELPQFLNILKGDMSLVGPRPTLEYQVKEYDEFQKRRLEVKPGVTGWAQVNGRNNLTWPEKIKLDVWYVDNWSLLLDIKIIFKTFYVVLFNRNIYSETSFEDDVLDNDSEGKGA